MPFSQVRMDLPKMEKQFLNATDTVGAFFFSDFPVSADEHERISGGITA